MSDGNDAPEGAQGEGVVDPPAATSAILDQDSHGSEAVSAGGSVKKHKPGGTPFWRWFLSPVVILIWLALAAGFSSYQGKLVDVQENDSAAWLPESAESTKVVELQKKFRDNEQFPAVVVYERKSGITEQDRTRIASDVDRIKEARITDLPISPPQDGKQIDGSVRAVVVSVPLAVESTGEGWNELKKQTDQIHDIADGGDGLNTYVTGQAGISADFAAIFDDIDGFLILVAGIVVVSILLVVYRSPILPIVVLISVSISLAVASAIIYFLAKSNAIELNGQSQSILSVLVFGAGTDYALLLVARYREELHRHQHAKDAMKTAYRASFAPIVASGSTVAVGLMCLLLSDLSSNKGLGPVAAIGIVSSILVGLTFLPATLAVLRRAAFWPFMPKMDAKALEAQHGLWSRIAQFVGRHQRLTWVVSTAGLLIAALYAGQLDTSGLSQDEAFRGKPQSIKGLEVVSESFSAGNADPTTIIAKADKMPEVIAAAKGVRGVSPDANSIYPTVKGEPGPNSQPHIEDGLVELNVILNDAADSDGAKETVKRLRTAVHKVDGADARVGGIAAVSADIQKTASRDLRVIIPAVLIVIFIILALLLRALVAPLLLIGSVVLSFAATLGISTFVFEHIFDFKGSDPSVPLFGFIFLVALGIDYNIFLMTRVREESGRLGTRAGTLAGLRVTGGVITSAGLVLAATFSALGVLPMVFVTQMGFIVAFGVLLDTLIVRSLLVPAVTLELGRKVWLPGKLARGKE